jgi:hypothetical protein
MLKKFLSKKASKHIKLVAKALKGESKSLLLIMRWSSSEKNFLKELRAMISTIAKLKSFLKNLRFKALRLCIKKPCKKDSLRTTLNSARKKERKSYSKKKKRLNQLKRITNSKSALVIIIKLIGIDITNRNLKSIKRMKKVRKSMNTSVILNLIRVAPQMLRKSKVLTHMKMLTHKIKMMSITISLWVILTKMMRLQRIKIK